MEIPYEIAGYFSFDAIGIFLSFSGHTLTVEITDEILLLKLSETGILEPTFTVVLIQRVLRQIILM